MGPLTRRSSLALLAAGALPAPAAPGRGWFVPAAEAKGLIERGALALDAREPRLRAADPVPGAVDVAWDDLAEAGPSTAYGRLLADDAELTRRLRAWGVRAGVPVVVLADPVRGWGEDGRVVWSLRALGHDLAFAVDGGLPALRAAGLPAIAASAPPGDFAVRRRADLVVAKEALKAELGRPGLVVLDVREPREFAGETPYGESRGGHVPGARHLWWRDLLAPDGRLLPPDRIRAELAARGIEAGGEVVAYCTVGLRAGWATSVLNDLGYRARNYAGSMRDWSAGDAAEYPLVDPGRLAR